jgi:tetratricopeptide (TPR) repeat protein
VTFSCYDVPVVVQIRNLFNNETMNRPFIHTTLSCALVLLILGAALPAVSRDKVKSAPVVRVKSDTLSYRDQRRYSYFFLEAVRQENAGNNEAAFNLLSQCLRINPRAAEAYFRQALHLNQMKKDSLALQYLEKAASLRPDNGTYQEKLAEMYIGMGNYAKAIDAYEHLYSANKSRSDVLGMLLQLYKQQNDYPKMLDVVGRIEQQEGQSDQLTLTRMNIYEMMGDSKNAYLTLKALAGSHPNDLSFSVMLGNWLMQNKKPKEAYKIFSKALDEEPDNAYALGSMYDYYRATGENALAQEMMQRILLGKNTPSDSRTQFLKQAIQESEQAHGDSAQLIALIEQVSGIVPNDVNVAGLKAAYYTAKKLPQEVINKSLEQLLAIQPDNAGARFQLIQAKWQQNNWKEIAQLSEPGMLYNPEEMAFYYFTGLARYYQKDDDGALDAFQRGTAEINDKSDPGIVSDFYAIMGEIYHNKGERQKAYAAYDSCLQWKPDQVMTLNNYAYYISVDGGDLKRAEEMSARAVKAEPKNATFLDTYAWVLYKQERYTEAKIYIDQALKNDTDSVPNADILEHAGDIYLKIGDAKTALRMWQQALDNGGDKSVLSRKLTLYKKEK